MSLGGGGSSGGGSHGGCSHGGGSHGSCSHGGSCGGSHGNNSLASTAGTGYNSLARAGHTIGRGALAVAQGTAEVAATTGNLVASNPALAYLLLTSHNTGNSSSNGGGAASSTGKPKADVDAKAGSKPPVANGSTSPVSVTSHSLVGRPATSPKGSATPSAPAQGYTPPAAGL